MKRPLKAAITVAVGLAAGVLGYHFTAQAVADNPPARIEGIPMTFDLVEANCISSGATFKYRSRKFACTADTEPWLMNDPHYPGERGQHGDVTWIHVPDDRTVTIFPGHVTNATPASPSWEGEVVAFAAAHPDVRVITAGQYPGQLVDGQFVEMSTVDETLPPDPECDDPSYVVRPTIMEFRLEVSGNMAGFQPPASLNHFIYRVPQPRSH